MVFRIGSLYNDGGGGGNEDVKYKFTLFATLKSCFKWFRSEYTKRNNCLSIKLT